MPPSFSNVPTLTVPPPVLVRPPEPARAAAIATLPVVFETA